MMEKNKLPDYVIEESIPRFSGIDSPVLASVKANKYNKLIKASDQAINGHYILTKESCYDSDTLFLKVDKSNTHVVITLLSDQAFDRKKKQLKAINRFCNSTDDLLWGFQLSQLLIYVAPEGFSKYFKIKTLKSEIGVEYKNRYSFDENKLKVNHGYEIRNSLVPGIIGYGILNSIHPSCLEFTTIERDGSLSKYKLLVEYVVNGTIEIEAVDL
jgi:hypothetical protein